jgi:hypothetical protein
MCNIQRKGFIKPLSDNEESYLSYLVGIIERVDELASLQITRKLTTVGFRLSPSLPKYNDMLLEEILKVHNLFNIKLDISKSIKTTNTIEFQIPVA